MSLRPTFQTRIEASLDDASGVRDSRTCAVGRHVGPVAGIAGVSRVLREAIEVGRDLLHLPEIWHTLVEENEIVRVWNGDIIGDERCF